MENSSKSNWLVPGSIVVADALIAGAIVYSIGNNASQQETSSVEEIGTK